MAREFVHVVSDASDTRTSLGLLLETEGFCVQFYETGKAFLDRLRSAKGRVLAVIRMPGLDGMELLRSLQTAAPTPLVVMLMLHSDVPLAVEAMKLGVALRPHIGYMDIADTAIGGNMDRSPVVLHPVAVAGGPFIG